MCDHPLILLCVDDEPLRDALRFALETEGYAVTVQADARPVDCIIIDNNDRTWPAVTEVPTIVLTGDLARFGRRDLNNVWLVEKPLLDDGLSARLSQLLHGPPTPYL